MEFEERIKALEDEFSQAQSETKQLLLDIRALLMEAWSPLRTQSPPTKSPSSKQMGKG